MPDYVFNDEKSVLVPIDLPSTPGGKFWIPSRLGVGRRRRAENASLMRIPDINGRLSTDLNIAELSSQLAFAAVEHPDFRHNLQRDKQNIDIDQAWIEESMDEGDFDFLAGQCLQVYQNQLTFEVAFRLEDPKAVASAEGEGEPGATDAGRGKAGRKRTQKEPAFVPVPIPS